MHNTSISLHVFLTELKHDGVNHNVAHPCHTLKSFLSKGQVVYLFESETLKGKNFHEGVVLFSLNNKEEIIAVNWEK